MGTIMYVLLTITTDYTDNMTENVMKSVFRGWSWARRTWLNVSSCEERYDSDSESDDFSSPPAVYPSHNVPLKAIVETKPHAVPNDNHNGELYYQSSA